MRKWFYLSKNFIAMKNWVKCLIPIIFLLLLAALAGWFFRPAPKTSVLEEFDSYLRRNQVEQAVSLVMENKYKFRRIFHYLIERGLRYRFHSKPDSADAAMKAAEEIAGIYENLLQDSFLRREFEFGNGLKGEMLRKKMELDSMYYEAYSHQRKSDYPAALSIYEKSLQLSREIGDTRREVDHLLQIQTILYRQDFNHQALQIALQGLEIAHQIGYRFRKEWLLHNIGNARIELGQYRQALTDLEAGLETAEKMEDTNCRLNILSRLGIPLWRLGEYAEALEKFNTAIEFCQGLGNRPIHLAYIFIDRGNVYKSMGDFTKSEYDYKTALQLSQTPESRDQVEALALLNLGELYQKWGRYEESLDCLLRASEVYKELESFYNYAATLKSVGDVKRDQRQLKSAIEKYHHAQTNIQKGRETGVNRSGRLYSEISLSIGDIYVENKKWESALEFYNKGLDTFRQIEFSEGIVNALTRIGNIFREKKDYQTAVKNLNEAQKMAIELNAPLLESNACFATGLVYRDQGVMNMAEKFFARAIDTVESTWNKIEGEEKISYFATVQDMYDEMILLQNQKRNYRSAFNYSERSRARAFLEYLRKKGSISANKAVDGIQTPTLSEIQESLDPEIQVVEYKITREKLLVFVVDKNNLKLVECPVSRTELNQLVVQYRQAIGATDYGVFKKRMANNAGLLYREGFNISQKLYSLIFKAVENEISPNKILYIIPDEVLFYLPFAALVSTGDDPEFLVQKYTISLAPSTAILKYSRDNHKPLIPSEQMRLLAVANPLGDLPHAEKEARNIAAMFSRVDTLIGAGTTENKALKHLQQQSFEVLHFATHALVDERSPLYTHLVLGTESILNPETSHRSTSGSLSPEDDLLMAYEVLHLTLEQTRLVCLSACKTAGGRLYRGEGIVGLTRAFISAGTSSVITSLWDIDDEYTEKLMTEFYGQWMKNNLTKAEALRAAQLKVIEELSRDSRFRHPHPHRWAAFTLTGDYF
jgi:CHAT domain-containing protein